MPTRYEKIEKYSEIIYSMRPRIGKYAWDQTIFKNEDETHEPIEVIESQVEIEEDIMLKISFGIDQMFIEEEETEDDEEITFVDLSPAPEVQSESNEGEEKTKVQSKITAFFTEK